MNKKILIAAAVLLAAVCFVTLILCGGEFTIEVPAPQGASPDDFSFTTDYGSDVIELTDRSCSDGVLTLTFRTVKRGREFIIVTDPEGENTYRSMYIHLFGIVTDNEFFGKCKGDNVIPVAIIVFLALLLYSLIRQYRSDVRKNLYQYRNIRMLGLILFVASLLLGQIPHLFRYGGTTRTIESLLHSTDWFSSFALPIAFILSILMTVSNIQLMKKEGRTSRNMLASALSILLCLATVFPMALSEILQRSNIVDIHSMNKAAMYVEIAVETAATILVTYLECILIGTIVLGVKAARHVPSYDRDYMIILGCQTRSDGTLTNLLQSRADRALDFASAQKDAGGSDIVFVPSGGQGPDEPVSEAGAIRNYLASNGVGDARILVEDRSTNTYENMKNSMDIIRSVSETADPKIAFSTTNYHVFRAGLIASELGMDAEGVGSPTKRYFWINAFIREFVATLFSERKSHLKTLVILLVIMIVMIAAVYVSNNV